MTDAIQKAREALDEDKIPTWPPLKKALWHVVTGEALNDGHYINAYDLTDKLHAAALAALDAETPATPVDVGELVERLNGENPDKVVATDRLRMFAHDPDTFSFDQHDAIELIDTIEEAATALERVVRERDAARANAEIVCNSYADENQRLYDRATAAEAKLAEARKVIEPFADCNMFNDTCPDNTPAWWTGAELDETSDVTVGDFRAARRFLEETK